MQTYALEFGDRYIRVFKDGGQVLYADGEHKGEVFELATPYAESELFKLKFTQSADVMTIVHTDHPPMELQRYDHDDWRLAEVETKNGPFEDINTDKAIKVYASASTGTVTLTATHNIFGSEQVGKQFYRNSVLLMKCRCGKQIKKPQLTISVAPAVTITAPIPAVKPVRCVRLTPRA